MWSKLSMAINVQSKAQNMQKMTGTLIIFMFKIIYP